MASIIKDHIPEFEKVSQHLSEELSGIRTGRASASLVEHVMVDMYGTFTPLKNIASISVPDARSLAISPWDKSALKEIEKAITQANLGVNPMNDGEVVRISLPQLTEENRKALAKLVGTRVEAARISVRQVRDKIKDAITKMEKNKEITEDDRYALIEELDTTTRSYTDALEEMKKKKEDDIMTI